LDTDAAVGVSACGSVAVGCGVSVGTGVAVATDVGVGVAEAAERKLAPASEPPD
jgi:hypothetical protein